MRERSELEEQVIDALRRYGVPCTREELTSSSLDHLQRMLVSVERKLSEQEAVRRQRLPAAAAQPRGGRRRRGHR